MDRLYRVNVKGLYFCSLEAVNSMVAGGKGGSIVNLASIASLVRREEGMCVCERVVCVAVTRISPGHTHFA